MTKIIETLTDEMKARIPLTKSKWIDIGTNCDRLDLEKFKKGAHMLYKEAGLKPIQDKHFYVVQSPIQGIELAAQWVLGDEVLPYGHKDLPEVTKEQKREQNFNQCYGQHDASWLSFYDFFKPELPEEIAPLEGYFMIAEAAHWWWAFENAIIVCDKPLVLQLDDEDRLHCEDGPAVKYTDDFAVYVWHGVRVPEWVIETPEKMNVDNVMAEDNMEVRRAMMEKYDMAKFLQDAGAITVQSDEFGDLIEIKGLYGNADEVTRYCHVKDSSTDRMYAICVPPETETCRGGLAWSFGYDSSEDYAPTIES